jgi:hypothetical protein
MESMNYQLTIMRRKLRMRECDKPDEKEANRRVSRLCDGFGKCI